MSLIACIVVIIAISAPAGAQSWMEYEYPNEGFTVAFPDEPKAVRGRPVREVSTSFYTELSANLCEQAFEFAQFSFHTCDVGFQRREFGNVGGWRLSR